MTVTELRKLLEDMDSDAIVLIQHREGEMNIYDSSRPDVLYSASCLVQETRPSNDPTNPFVTTVTIS